MFSIFVGHPCFTFTLYNQLFGCWNFSIIFGHYFLHLFNRCFFLWVFSWRKQFLLTFLFLCVHVYVHVLNVLSFSSLAVIVVYLWHPFIYSISIEIYAGKKSHVCCIVLVSTLVGWKVSWTIKLVIIPSRNILVV